MHSSRQRLFFACPSKEQRLFFDLPDNAMLIYSMCLLQSVKLKSDFKSTCLSDLGERVKWLPSGRSVILLLRKPNFPLLFSVFPTVLVSYVELQVLTML